MGWQLAVWPAAAQMGGAPLSGGPPGGRLRGQHGAGANQSTPAPPPLKGQPEAWPRLDPGAILCSSRDALKTYQDAIATSDADSPAPLPSGCSRVTQAMAVSIVGHDGPSRSQVKSTAPPDREGWTDAWLPDKPP